MEQLKPCPFCGKKPRISCAIEGKIRWTISCHEEVSRWGLVEDIKDIERAKAKAMKVWNRRANDE